MGDETGLSWAKKFLKEKGFRVKEECATIGLSAVVRGEAEDAVLGDNGELVLKFMVWFPGGEKKVLTPPEIAKLADELREQEKSK